MSVHIISNVSLKPTKPTTAKLQQQKLNKRIKREKPSAVAVEPLQSSMKSMNSNSTESDTKGRVPPTPYILNGILYKVLSQNGENVMVQCRHCPEDRIYRGSVRSTGNFHMHIKRRHPELMDKLHEMKVGALLARRGNYQKNRIDRMTSQSRRSQKNVVENFALNNNNINCTASVKEEPTSSVAADDAAANIANVLNQTSSQAMEQQQQQHQQQNLKIKTALLHRHQEAQRNDVDMLATTHEESLTPRMLPLEVELMTTSDNSISISPTSAQQRDFNNMHLRSSSMNPGTLNIKKELLIAHAQSMPCQAEPLDLSFSIHSMEDVNKSVTGSNFGGLLLRMEAALQNVNNALETRNQLESERINIELAKFMHLHPTFKYERN